MTNTRPPEDTTMALSQEAKMRKYKKDVEYNASHTTRIAISLNNKTDADIIAYLQTTDNKQGLFKELLRTRMAEEGFTYDPNT